MRGGVRQRVACLRTADNNNIIFASHWPRTTVQHVRRSVQFLVRRPFDVGFSSIATSLIYFVVVAHLSTNYILLYHNKTSKIILRKLSTTNNIKHTFEHYEIFVISK